MPVSFLPPPPAWLDQALRKAQPPEWLLHEAQLRAVLFMNHVLQANPHALPRTRRLAGRSVQMRWQGQAMQWVFTPVGLLDAVKVDQVADLILDLGDVSPWQLANHVLQRQRPPLRIEGDVQMAAEVNWLVDHVRWSPEEDLARLIGDAPARAAFQAGQRIAQALRAFAPARPETGAA